MLRRLILTMAVLFTMAVPALAQSAAVSASVNLRAGPGPQHAVVTVVPKGAVVEVGRCASGWCEVSYRSRRGFVSQTYVVASVPKVPPHAGALLAPPHSIGFRDAFTAAPRTAGAGCFVNGALWAIGRPATAEVVRRARWGAAARSVEIARHGFEAKRPFVPHRLTLAVDRRNVIWGATCG